MTKRHRIEKAERKAGAGQDENVIIVTWSDDGQPDPGQVVNMGGVLMTYAEFQRRNPDAKTKTVEWDDIDYG